MAVVNLTIQTRGKPIRGLPKNVRIAYNASTGKLYRTLADASAISVNRLRVTIGRDRIVLPNDKANSLKEAEVTDHSAVYVKDLGPQISWRTVYIAEYLGPALIPSILLFPLRPYLYRNFHPVPEPTSLQVLIYALLTIHFWKREYESIFIHRFGTATMPARNLFRNSGYYWLAAGVNIPYWVFRPDAAAAQPANSFLLYAGLFLFVFGELANLNAHLVLRDLRRSGSSRRGIPVGFGFGLVTCPNYLFEIVAWVGMYLVSQLSWSILIPTIIGSVQMGIWARKRERRYQKHFGDRYRRKRFAMIPGIV